MDVNLELANLVAADYPYSQTPNTQEIIESFYPPSPPPTPDFRPKPANSSLLDDSMDYWGYNGNDGNQYDSHVDYPIDSSEQNDFLDDATEEVYFSLSSDNGGLIFVLDESETATSPLDDNMPQPEPSKKRGRKPSKQINSDKKETNRAAASRYRAKKKQLGQEAESEMKKAEASNTKKRETLKAKINALVIEIDYLLKTKSNFK